MSVGSELKNLCRTCGQVACRGCGIFVLSFVITAAELAHTTHPGVLKPEQPHTEHQMDTRQVRELPKLSVATTSTVVFRASFGPGLQLSGFRSDASDMSDMTGEVTHFLRS
jgi:hypothetical protein